MLGATQSVNMITSLKKNYGRVEVAVLNVDLLPNVIDMVVIGDRLFSLPIQVEGRDDNVETGVHMDLDDGMNDDANADKATEEGDQGDREKIVKTGQEDQVTKSFRQVVQERLGVFPRKLQPVLLPVKTVLLQQALLPVTAVPAIRGSLKCSGVLQLNKQMAW
jgi:hypothetical protein